MDIVIPFVDCSDSLRVNFGENKNLTVSDFYSKAKRIKKVKKSKK